MRRRDPRWALARDEVSTQVRPEWCSCLGGYCMRQWCPDKRRVHDALRLDPRFVRLVNLDPERPMELDDDDRPDA